MSFFNSEVKDTLNIHNFKVKKKKNCSMIFVIIFRCFFTILVITAAAQFVLHPSSSNSISEPNNRVCVLRAIEARYEAVFNVHMYVSICLKVSVNYSQPGRVFVFFHTTLWVNSVLRIFNIEGQQNCMIGSKVITIF